MIPIDTRIWDRPKPVAPAKRTVESRLKPCPFCGAVAKLDEDRKPGWKFVRCTGCRAEVGEVTRFKSQVAFMWNRRVNI